MKSQESKRSKTKTEAIKSNKKSFSVVVLRTLSTGVFSPSVAENQWSRPSRTAGG